MANEKRLISYDVVIAHLDSCIEQGKGLFKSVCVAIKCFVEQMPTVDAVEVVYCDECKSHGSCIPEDTFRWMRIEKPYCCVGKRKTNTNFDAKMDGDGNG